MQPVVTVGPDGSPGRLAAARRAADGADGRGLTPGPPYARPLPAPGPARVPQRAGRNRPARRSARTARAVFRARRPHRDTVGSPVADAARTPRLRVASDPGAIAPGVRGPEPVGSRGPAGIGMPAAAREERPVPLRAVAPAAVPHGPCAAVVPQ
ncbi:hypothetical protein [Streptomyces sp. NPDC017202]|uniref:hypothetical protein n=1 Tax=Streptomyces sp. NPDC017202 TaxID=3364981 RepID=UPI0037AE5617